MKIGFIGTGTITAAMIDGLMASQLEVAQIMVSPRNGVIADRLARQYPCVHIAKSNQDVIDRSEQVFICLRSQIAEETLKHLDFSHCKLVVSVLAMVTAKQAEEWVGQPVYRAVPLPFVSERRSLTAIYPDHPFLRTMFDALGGSIVVEDENQFNLMMTAGSLMGVYFNMMETSSQWLQNQGLDGDKAIAFLSTMFGNLADETRKSSKPDYSALEQEFSTKNGTNALVSQLFDEHGGRAALTDGLQAAYERIKGL